MRLAIPPLLVMMISLAFGQEITHFNVTQQQGLPSNTVYDVYQDKKGFLWTATENGLARYNGSAFKAYNNSQTRSTAVTNLTEDSKGRVWVHNFFGEILFVDRDTLKKLNSWEQRYQQGFPTMTSLGDTLLISSPTHLFRYIPQSDQWKEIRHSPAHVNISFHYEDPQGTTWIIHSGLKKSVVSALYGSAEYILDHEKYNMSQNVGRLFMWSGAMWLFDASTHTLLELKAGDVYDRTAEFRSVLPSTRSVRRLDEKTLAFIGTDGVQLLMMESGKFVHIVKGKNCSAITRDNEGGLWVATLNEGLFYLPSLESNMFEKQRHGLFTRLALNPADQSIIAGNYSGAVQVISPDGNFRSHIPPKSNKEVQSLFVDDHGKRLFVYTDHLRVYDLRNQQLLHEVRIPAIKRMLVAEGVLALATSAGLFLMNENLREDSKVILSSRRVTSLCFDERSHTIWAGTQKGLYLVDTRKITAMQWASDSLTADLGISTLRMLANGQVAAGTSTNGIYFIKNDKVVHHLSIANGLPSNKINVLTEGDGFLWIGTDRGVVRYNLASLSLSVIGKTKGLASEEIFDLAYAEGTLWVAHGEGLQYFSAFQMDNAVQPLLHLQSASSNEKTLSTETDVIELTPDSQQLSLSFDIANNLKGQGNSKILFRIAGLHKGQWQSVSLKNPIINFMSLPFGNWMFEAKAVNEDGVPSTNTIRLHLKVLAPFWKQVWFLALVATGIAILLLAVVYYRVRKLSHRREARLQQLNREQELRIAQLTSLRSQMNPHFIFNTMSLIQGKALHGQGQEASDTINRFSKLMRRVLDYSGREMISLQEESDVLQSYLSIEKDRFDGMLEFAVNVDDAALEEIIRIPSMITQPFVENALRHGLLHKPGKKELSVDFQLSQESLVIHIDDNGIGRKASAEFNKGRAPEHQSFGINASQRRIDLLNASRKNKITLETIDKYDAHGFALGTTVIITIPIFDGNNG